MREGRVGVLNVDDRHLISQSPELFREGRPLKAGQLEHERAARLQKVSRAFGDIADQFQTVLSESDSRSVGEEALGRLAQSGWDVW